MNTAPSRWEKMIPKAHGRSAIRNLPAERQSEIIAMLKVGRMSDVRQRLADEGFKTSMRALSEFWRWWHYRKQYVEVVDALDAYAQGIAKGPKAS